MNLIQQIRHWAGLGLEINVELPRVSLCPGSLLTYHVSLESEEAIQVQGLRVEVLRGSEPPAGGGWGNETAWGAAPTTEAFEVQAGIPYRCTGAIQLPPDLPHTADDGENATFWALRVTADIPAGLDPSTTVEFVVGPSCSFTWQTDESIQINTVDQSFAITAQGTCTFVRINEHDGGATQNALSALILEVLADLLKEQPAFILDQGRSQGLGELAGALQELLTPKIRAAKAVPIDSVLDLEIAELTVDRAP